MNGQELFDLAPLGAWIAYSDGTPKPPDRFVNKVQDWQNRNGQGRFVHADGYEGHDGRHDHFLLETHRDRCVVMRQGFVPNRPNMSYEIVSWPAPGSILAYSMCGGTPEIAHVWRSIQEARAWADGERYDLRKYGRQHYIVKPDDTLADWDAAEAYAGTRA